MVTFQPARLSIDPAAKPESPAPMMMHECVGRASANEPDAMVPRNCRLEMEILHDEFDGSINLQ